MKSHFMEMLPQIPIIYFIFNYSFAEACVFDPLQDLLPVAVTLQLASATVKGTVNVQQ